MNILALDLGTKTGHALFAGGKLSVAGTRNCSTTRMELAGQRWTKFRALLNEQWVAAGEIHAVYFEDVKMHQGTIAAHVYGGFLSHLEHWCAVKNIPLMGVGFGAIKKGWTGKGNAKKDEMIAEARKRGFAPVDDNHADALAILAYALDAEGLVRQPVGVAA